MHASAKVIGLIKEWEGFRERAYQDIAGVWTIGYGDTKRVRPGMVITRQEGEERLARRLADEFEPPVNAIAQQVPTTQGQFDAMVSLAYNIGIGAFNRSSVARNHRARNGPKAAAGFLLWNKARVNGKLTVVPALAGRRAKERELYLGTVVTDAPDMPDTPNTPELSDEQIDGITETIVHLQETLKAVGLYEGVVEGVWGPLTQKAMEDFAAIAQERD